MLHHSGMQISIIIKKYILKYRNNAQMSNVLWSSVRSVLRQTVYQCILARNGVSLRVPDASLKIHHR